MTVSPTASVAGGVVAGEGEYEGVADVRRPCRQVRGSMAVQEHSATSRPPTRAVLWQSSHDPEPASRQCRAFISALGARLRSPLRLAWVSASSPSYAGPIVAAEFT